MEPTIIGLIGLGVLLILIFIGIPIGFCMMLAGALGCVVLTTMDLGVSILGVIPFSVVNNYTFALLPLFMVMGLIAYEGGLTTELFEASRKLLGHLPGGLAVAVIFAQACFATTTGSSLAASIIMSKIALPEMKKYNYNLKMATGAIAVGGTLGPLIPPSAGLILYGIITETSIGKLFISAIFPGILVTVLLILTVIFWVRIDRTAAMLAPSVPWRDRLVSLKGVWAVLLLFVIVIGGIYAGVFTPQEGGAIGAFFAIVITVAKRGLKMKALLTAFGDTVEFAGMIFILLIGAFVFNYFMGLSTLPMETANLALSLKVNPYIVYGFIVLVLLILGCVMDVPAMILLTMPVFFPVMTAMGFDPLWFGVVSVILSEVGFITPPVGMNVYVVAAASDVPLWTVFQGIWPFFGTLLLALVIITVFPQICTWLPNFMMT